MFCACTKTLGKEKHNKNTLLKKNLSKVFLFLKSWL
jgi:hypothetical protein